MRGKMVLSMYCKQRIIQLYFDRSISYGNVVRVLKAEGLVVPKKTVWKTIQKYKTHGTICRLPGSGRPFKLTGDMLKLIEDRMAEDDETTATQLLKHLENQGFNISQSSIIRARKTLGWTFHGSRYCQMIRARNKERRLAWAKANIGNNFEDVVWTDECIIQLENHRTFSYRNVGTAPKPKA